MHGYQLSRILKSLGLPSYAGKSKKKQIDTLIKHAEDGKAWIIAFPHKVLYMLQSYNLGEMLTC